MLRVTGGSWRGRRLSSSVAGVRPTQDAVRQALFSMLGNRVIGCRFLDLFAGTGAVGLDALSRGAAAVVWVERDRRVFAQLRSNVMELAGGGDGAVVGGDGDPPGHGLTRTRLFNMDVLRFLAGGAAPAGAFDVVFADPPYRAAAEGPVALADVLAALRRGGWVAPGGRVVLEHDGSAACGVLHGWRPDRERRYGGTHLTLLLTDDDGVGGAVAAEEGGT